MAVDASSRRSGRAICSVGYVPAHASHWISTTNSGAMSSLVPTCVSAGVWWFEDPLRLRLRRIHLPRMCGGGRTAPRCVEYGHPYWLGSSGGWSRGVTEPGPWAPWRGLARRVLARAMASLPNLSAMASLTRSTARDFLDSVPSVWSKSPLRAVLR